MISNNSAHALPLILRYCNVMNFCGFPMNSQLANTLACPLYKGMVVPSNQADAVCFNNATNLGSSCTINNNLNSAIDNLNKKLKDQQETDWVLVLSVLFNAFIMCQVSARPLQESCDFNYYALDA